MTVTRVPLCSVKWCPAPSSPDFHICWVCQATDRLDHQHIEPRGMGGSPSRRDDPDNIVILCRTCHERITLHDWGNAVIDTQATTGAAPTYRVWDLRNNTVIEREMGWWRNGEVQTPGRGDNVMVRQQHSKLPDTSLVLRVHDGYASDYEAWCEEIRGLGLMHRSLGWLIGDKINEGEDAGWDVWGAGVLDDLGVAYETLRNMSWVARAIPPVRRRDASFSLHAVYAAAFNENPEEGRRLLDAAIAEKLSSHEARLRLRPPQSDTHKCCQPEQTAGGA